MFPERPKATDVDSTIDRRNLGPFARPLRMCVSGISGLVNGLLARVYKSDIARPYRSFEIFRALELISALGAICIFIPSLMTFRDDAGVGSRFFILFSFF